MSLEAKKMAWSTMGTSNEDMCNKMQRLGLLSDNLSGAFRNVDRGDFAFGSSPEAGRLVTILVHFAYLVRDI